MTICASSERWCLLRSPRARNGPHLRPGRDRGRADPRRGARRERPPELRDRRPPRHRRKGVARAGPLGARQLGVRVSAAADHRKPGAGRSAEGGARLRPGDRRGPAGRHQPARQRRARAPRPRRRARPRRLDPAGLRRPRDGRGGSGSGAARNRDRRRLRPGGGAGRRGGGEAARAHLTAERAGGWRDPTARAGVGAGPGNGERRREPTSRSSRASPGCGGRSRLPPRVVTACSWLDRPAAARLSPLDGCLRCSLRSAARSCSK